jgi:hypothetical protein
MGAIIKLLTTYNELKEKINLSVNSTTQRFPKEIIKNFLIEDFQFATGVNDTGGKP